VKGKQYACKYPKDLDEEKPGVGGGRLKQSYTRVDVQRTMILCCKTTPIKLYSTLPLIGPFSNKSLDKIISPALKVSRKTALRCYTTLTS